MLMRVITNDAMCRTSGMKNTFMKNPGQSKNHLKTVMTGTANMSRMTNRLGNAQ